MDITNIICAWKSPNCIESLRKLLKYLSVFRGKDGKIIREKILPEILGVMHGCCCWFYLFTDVLICSDHSSRLLKAEEYSRVVFTSVPNGKSALCSKPHGATQFCSQGLHHNEGSKDTGKHPWRKWMTYDCPRCARPFPQHRPQLKPQEAHMFPCHLGQNTPASLLLLFLYNIPRCFTWETRQIPCQSFCLGRRVLLLRRVLMESEWDRSKACSPKPFFFLLRMYQHPWSLLLLQRT